MKLRILIIVFLFAIFSPFLVYKYNKELSRNLLEFYINSRFKKIQSGGRISFSDFTIKSDDEFKTLIINNVSLRNKTLPTAVIKQINFVFKWDFPYTTVRPVHVHISDADIEIDSGLGEISAQSDGIVQRGHLDKVFSFASLLNTELFIKNVTINGVTIKGGFARIKKSHRKKTLTILLNEENSVIEAEFVKSHNDNISFRIKNFNPAKSALSAFIKQIKGLNIDNDDFTVDGYGILSLTNNILQGSINKFQGIFRDKITDNSKIVVKEGKFDFLGTNEKLELHNLVVQTDDGEFRGDISLGNQIKLEGNVVNIKYDAIPKYWNADTEGKRWYTDNIKNGLVNEAYIKLVDGSFGIESGSFSGVELQVPYKNTAGLKINQASGFLSIEEGSLELRVNKVQVDDLEIKGAHLAIDDSDIHIQCTSEDKIEKFIPFAQKVQEDVITQVKSQINLEHIKGKALVNLEMHLTNKEIVDFDLKASSTQIRGDNVFRAFPIDGGTLNLSVNKDKVDVQGNLQSLGEKVSLALTKDIKNDAMQILLKGSTPAIMLYQSKFAPDLKITNGLLSGEVEITSQQPNILHVKAKGIIENVESKYTSLLGKKKNAKDNFSLDLTINPSGFKTDRLIVTGEKFLIDVQAEKIKNHVAVKSNTIKVNDSIIFLDYSLADKKSDFSIRSRYLDLSEATDFSALLELNKGSLDDIRQDTIIKVDAIKMKNNISMENFSLNCKDSAGNISGIFNDGSLVSSRLSKIGGLTADITNIGTALRALNIKLGIIGGRASLYIGTKKQRTNQGILEVEHFYVQDAPVLAKILSLSSLYGVINVLNGEGIFFNKFHSNFQYGEGVISVEESWLESAPVGLSVKGIISIPEESLILYGGVVPLYRLNKIISQTPIIGSLLTGGTKRGIISAEYKLTREQGKSNVSVNTLATFTPTILHRLLNVFEG